MSDLKKAAQQALELDAYGEPARAERDAAITALKAALAEPTGKDDLQVEPVAYRYWSTKWHSWEYSDAPPVFPAVPAGTKVEPLYLASAPKDNPWQTPVGTVHRDVKTGVIWRLWPGQLPNGTHLYIEPPAPQRQPLTEEQIIALRKSTKATDFSAWSDSIAFARAIERAHGIGGQDE